MSESERSSDSFDLALVGGGPGGYVAAIRARQLGMSVALVEREHLGGICLNWGCIPTKALLRASEIRHLLEQAGEFGLEVGDVRIDVSKMVQRSRRIAKRLNAGVKHLMKKNEVQVFDGHARLASPGVLHVEKDGETRELRASHVVLATGARARSLPGIEPDGDRIWTYREAMVPESLPASILVIGSGAIGIEFASFYHDLGVEVTVVEILPRILPAEDAEISDLARKAFERQGIAIHTESSVESVERTDAGVVARVKLASGEVEEIAVERVISAVGIRGNVEELGLENTAVRVERGHICVDEWCRTDEEGLYAIGDVAGGPALAHKASHEGVICVEHIAGHAGTRPLERTHIPGCTYSRPQIASVGYSEAAAQEAGHEVRVGRYPLQANGKALAIGDTQGLVKTVFDAATGELLGAHMLGPEVTEMIQGFAIARTLETTEAELMETVFPHPTVSESMHEAVLAAYDRALNI